MHSCTLQLDLAPALAPRSRAPSSPPLSACYPCHAPFAPRSYVPFLSEIFNIVPLSVEEWQLVLLWSLPVILLDEVLKLFARLFFGVKDVKPKMD